MKINPPLMEENLIEYKEQMLKRFPIETDFDIDETVWETVEEFIKTESLYEITDVQVSQPNSKLILITLGTGYCDTMVGLTRQKDKIYLDVNAAKWHELIHFKLAIETNEPKDSLYSKFITIQDAHFYDDKQFKNRSWENLCLC